MKYGVLLLILLILPGVAGLGISPARVVLSEPGEFVFTPVSETAVNVRVEGDLSQYISVSARVAKGGTLRGTLTQLPPILPGTHTQRVILTPVSSETGGTVSAVAEVVGLIDVVVPYPEAFITGDFSLSHDAETTLFTVMLQNFGTTTVVPEAVTLSIGGVDVELLPKPLPFLEPQKHQKHHSVNLSPGMYDVMLTVPYNGDVFTKEKKLRIGSPGLTISAVHYHAEDQGDVKPLDVSGTVEWNEPLEVQIVVEGAETLNQSVVASQDYDARFYIEQASEQFTITVSALDVQVKKVYVKEEIIVQQPSAWVWVIFTIVIFALWVLYSVYRRQKQRYIKE